MVGDSVNSSGMEATKHRGRENNSWHTVRNSATRLQPGLASSSGLRSLPTFAIMERADSSVQSMNS